MKIIANLTTGYLLEATYIEMPALLGHNSHYDDGCPNRNEFKCGYEIDLRKIIQAAQLVRGLDPTTLKGIHEKLCMAQQELEKIQELASSLVLFDILQDQSL